LWTDIFQTGNLIHELRDFEAPPTVACWQADGKAFITGSLDSRHAIEIWDQACELVFRFPQEFDRVRIYDMALSPDQERLVALAESKIYVYDYSSREKLNEFNMLDYKMTSLCISPNSEFMLISMNPNKIALMLIRTGEVVQTFEGHKQEGYLIRSSFGGAGSTFVVSGSEGLSSHAQRRFRIDR
jgi:WD repeat-containing protein 26